MKKILIITTLLLSSIPAWSMDSKEMEEIINSIIKSNSYLKEKKPISQKQEITVQPIKKDKSAEFERPANISLSAPSPDEALLKSGIQLFEASFYENAKQNFEKFRAEYPESNYRDLASIWLSKIYLKEKNPEKAMNILKSIGSDSGEFPSALSLLGSIYLQKGDDAAAIEYFYRIASLFPDHELADDSLIEIANLYVKNNKGNQAIEAAIKVIKNYKERETLDDAYFLIASVFEKDKILRDFSISRRIYKIFIKKAKIDKEPIFSNSPLIEMVENNLRNIETTYYGKVVTN